MEGKGKAVNILGQGGIRFNTVHPYSGDMCWYIPVLGAILYPYTAEGRDVLESIHPPRPKRFPKDGDFAPRGPRDCPKVMSTACQLAFVYLRVCA